MNVSRETVTNDAPQTDFLLHIETLVPPFLCELSAPPLPSLEPLKHLSELVSRWSLRVDLVAGCSSEEFVVRHVCDSLALGVRLAGIKRGRGVLDIGSGGGFPGLVTAIQFPDEPVVLVEPREKRAMFLQEARRELGLANVKVVRAKVEELTESFGATTFTTRATGIEAVIHAQALKLLPSATLAFMVGPSWSPLCCPGVTFEMWSYPLPRSAGVHSVATANVSRGTSPV